MVRAAGDVRAGRDRVEGVLGVVARGRLLEEHVGLVVGDSERVPIDNRSRQFGFLQSAKLAQRTRGRRGWTGRG